MGIQSALRADICYIWGYFYYGLQGFKKPILFIGFSISKKMLSIMTSIFDKNRYI